MKIELDFGGVIGDHISIRIEEARTLWGIELTPETAQRDLLLPRIGEIAYRELVDRGVLRLADVPLHAGVHDVLDQLTRSGDHIVVVSMQTPPLSERALRDFLTRKKLPIDTVCVVNSDEDKVARCQEQGVDIFLDDQPNVLALLAPLGIPLVWANFYQWKIPADIPFHIVHSWYEFAYLVGNLRDR